MKILKVTFNNGKKSLKKIANTFKEINCGIDNNEFIGEISLLEFNEFVKAVLPRLEILRAISLNSPKSL